jgi:hypothetical protein
MSSRTEDHKLKVSIKHDNRVTHDILCEVYLPKRLTEPIELVFRPTPQQSIDLDWPFEFSIYGETRDLLGEPRTLIKADKVYYKHGSTKHWGHEISESVIIAEPIDLRITHYLGSDKKEEKEKNTTKGTFWLTPNIMLTPVKSLIRSLTGEVAVNHIRNFAFTLENGIKLKFSHHYRFLQSDNGDMISFPELVAEFEIDAENEDIVPSLEPIDDFLMLTSFLARQGCVCLDWETHGLSKFTKFYRRDITIPDINKGHSFNDTLVDIKDFEEFISIAYKSFVKSREQDLLKQAVYSSIGRENATFESNYLRLYSALETLVLLYRKSHDLELIVTNSEWTGFREELKSFIRSHPLFLEKKNKRELLYEKLPELTRVSFSAAFNRFCEFYSIDLNDLWPVVDKREGISLSEIRNGLVHGDTFDRREQRALISAGEHLRWVVERSILSMLGCQYSESKVSQMFLAKNMTMYKEWIEDRKILTESG